LSLTVALLALLALTGICLWRPHGVGPALAVSAALGLMTAAGLVAFADLERAAETLWRPFVSLVALMVMTQAAQALGIVEWLAAIVEPRTRGPVRHAYRVTFALAAVASTLLSNDAAILLVTPTVLTVIKTVYPRRHPKFTLPFAYAVFAAAGVAPLVISNPMNLVVASEAGISFNAYAARMAPVALVGWVVAYAVLARIYRATLADEDPALGHYPDGAGRLGPGGRAMLGLGAVVVGSYPVVSAMGGPLWLVTLVGAALALVLCSAAPVPLGKVVRGVSFGLLPFLFGVFVLALALERAGVVGRMAWLYGHAPAPLATVGVTSAMGSALLNNHPMALMNAMALAKVPELGDPHVLAALVGGDLGPRLLPMGSLAGLLWIAVLRRLDVPVDVRTFVRVGILVTVPTLVASLLTLALVTALG
jgi:arsenical pump membrane protein